MEPIHLQVCAGLANRLRALVSGICFAEDLKRPLVLHWPPLEPSCCAHFESLFDPSSLPPFVTVVPEYPQRQRLTQCLSQDDLDKIKEKQGQEEQAIYNLKSYGWFHRSDPERWLKHLRALKPSQYIEERLSKLSFENTLGVHIRRGDNEKSIQGSPLSIFLDLLAVNASPKFFVATDDADVRAIFQKHFPQKCIFVANVLARNTEQGMIEAAIDFFALSRCEKILGSVYSSFSDIAALYGKTELILAKAH